MFIGLDIHKRYNQACVMSDSGDIVQEERFMNTAEELNKFLESPMRTVIMRCQHTH